MTIAHLRSESDCDVEMMVEKDVDGEKTKMVVESAWSEGEVLENWFTFIKPCLMKNSRPLIFF